MINVGERLWERITSLLFPQELSETTTRQSVRKENLARIFANPPWIHRAGELTTTELNRLREHRIVD